MTQIYPKVLLYILFNTMIGPLALGQVHDLTSSGPLRIAILGCHKQFEPAPALFRYLEAEPDLCLWIGDNIYADTKDDITFIDSCYQALAAKPAFKQLIQNYPYMATWDDHDFGLNNAGRFYPLKAQSKQRFRTFWGLEADIPEDRDGIYYDQRFNYQNHTVQVLMLDVRYNRDDPGTNGDPLGENQWQWLAQALEKEADLKILVSGFQILLDESSGSETWESFPDARERLFQLIRKKQVENILFLTGDQHYGEVCRLENKLDFDAIELQFAGINQIEKPEFNSYRISNVITSKHSYAYLDVYFNETKYDIPHLEFQVFDALSNQRELFYRVNLSALKLQVGFPKDTLFTSTQFITLDHDYPTLTLRYTIDGSIPDSSATIYQKPFPIDQSVVVKACYFDHFGNPRSKVYSQQFTKINPLSGIKPKQKAPGLQYAYYEGQFKDIPAFDQLTPVKQGIAHHFDLKAIAAQEDHYAILFEGLIDIPEEDVYTFYTYSDDGSKLFIDDQLVVNNAGSHSARKRTGFIPLQKGLHTIRIAYFEDYDGQTLQVGYRTNKRSERVLSFDQLFH